MKFNAIIEFETDPNTSVESLAKEYGRILDEHQLTYSHQTVVDRPEQRGIPVPIRVALRFHAECQITGLPAAHYLSQLLQGEAGLLSLNPNVISFSYTLF